MELRQIHYFIAVAETTSLTKAVGRLHIAQPALSQNIKSLEEELGTRLFDRSRQGMALTDSGVIFLEHARGIILQVNRAKESIRNFDDNPSGTVSIATPASVANVLSVPLFQVLKKNYPAIELNLDEGLTGNIRQAFDMGLFDIILELNSGGSDTLSVEPLIREDLYFISQNIIPARQQTHNEVSRTRKAYHAVALINNVPSDERKSSVINEEVP